MSAKFQYVIHHDRYLGAFPFVCHWNERLQYAVIDYTGKTVADCRAWLKKRKLKESA